MLLQVILKLWVLSPLITCAVVGKGVVLGGWPVALVLEIEELEGLCWMVGALFCLSMTGSCTTICIIRFPCRLTWFCNGHIFKSILILQIILKTDILFLRLYVLSSAIVTFQIVIFPIAWYDLFVKKYFSKRMVMGLLSLTCQHIYMYAYN